MYSDRLWSKKGSFDPYKGRLSLTSEEIILQVDTKLEVQKNNSLLISVRKYTHMKWLQMWGRGADY